MLLLVWVTLAAYWTILYHASSSNNSRSIEAPNPASIGPNPTPSGTVDRLDTVPVPTSESETVFNDSKRWSESSVLDEIYVTPTSSNPESVIRKRILDDNGFEFPIQVVEELEFDSSGEISEVKEIFAYAANQILLVSPTPIDRIQILDIAEALGWSYLEDQSSPYLAVLQAGAYDFDTVDRAIQTISVSDSFITAEANHIYYASITPNDPKFGSGSQWGLSQDSDFDIDAPEGWNTRTAASNITIAIIDTGIRLDHEDLKDNIWTNTSDSSRNGFDEDDNGYVDDVHGYNLINPSEAPQDDNGHGTHVAGIAGARGNNGKGIAGVAWNVNLMAVKVLNEDGRGSTSNIAKGIDYAVENGASIINASWGSNSFSASIENAIKRAQDKGIPFVAAAGNSRSETPSYPSRSKIANVISVGSVSQFSSISIFSNYNDVEVDVMAPGSFVYSTWHETAEAYSTQNGTSMAAPLVSGVLALNMTEHPGDNYLSHKDRLIASCDRITGFERYCVSGGVVNLATSLEMDRVPIPPKILETSETKINIYEGQSAEIWATADSDTDLNYKWYHNGNPLDELDSELELNDITPDQQGEYKLEIGNLDGSISIYFSVIVYPRFRELEDKISPEVHVYLSDESHWQIQNIEGEETIANTNLEKNVNAFLEFRVLERGLLRHSSKLSSSSANDVRAFLSGPNGSFRSFDAEWESFSFFPTDSEPGYTTRVTLESRDRSAETAANAMMLRIPIYFESDELPPIVSERIFSDYAAPGTNIRFSVFSEQDDLQYQWYKDDIPLEGETENQLQFIVKSAEDQGTYYVIASNAIGSIKSKAATITLDTSPQRASTALSGSNDIQLDSGKSFILSMDVFGSEPITYQWYKDDQPIPGATSKELDFGLTSPAESGTYYLEVENFLNSSPHASPDIRVSIDEQIFRPRFRDFTKDSKQFVYEVGELFIHSMPNVAGSQPMEQTWFKNGEAIELDDSSLFFNVLKLDDTGVYYNEAKNSIGTDQSGRIELIVTPPTIEAVDGSPFSLPVKRPKNNENFYYIYQTEETWDGVDALEIYAAHAKREIVFDKDEEDRIIRIRWKKDQAARFGYSMEDVFQENASTTYLSNSGGWEEEVIFVPKGNILWFTLEPIDAPVRAWLDGFEEIKEPTIVEGIAFTPPALNRTVTLDSNVLAFNATYNWYRNDQLIPDANESTLIIDEFSESDFGEYHVIVSNEFGQIQSDSVDVSLDSIHRVIPEAQNIDFPESENATISLQQQDLLYNADSLNIELEDTNEAYRFTFDAQGPSTLEIRYNFRNADVILELDGAERELPSGENEERWFSVFIPEGTHNLGLSISAWRTPYIGNLYSISLNNKPWIKLSASDEPNFDQTGVPRVEYSGVEPLTLDWYKDGQLLLQADNLTSGSSYPFNRTASPLDHGSYQAEVTDANGNMSRSLTFFYDLGDDLRSILDTPNRPLTPVFMYDIGYTSFLFDQEIKAKGSASLLLIGPFTNRNDTVTWSDRNETVIRIGVSGQSTQFMIRSEGFPIDSAISYLSGDDIKSIPANQDWQAIVMELDGGRIELNIPDSDENSRIWIDDLTVARKAKFKKHPNNIATYLGANIRLEADAFEPNNLFLDEIRWYKDGERIESSSPGIVDIENVSLDDLGDYVARVTSESGEVVSSRTATVSILDKEFSEAIGYPGARITAQGPNPWRVDYDDSIEGSTSIISGDMEYGESSTIEIELDGPNFWGIYSYTFFDIPIIEKEGDNSWAFNVSRYWAFYDSYRIKLVVKEESASGIDQDRRMRLDGLRFSRFEDAQFDSWLNQKFDSLDTSLSESSRDRLADPDNDGIPNWLEFAMNLDPFSPSEMPRIGLSKIYAEDEEARIRFFAARSNEYSISYETSHDLQTWSPIQPSLEVISTNSEYDEIQATFDPNTKARQTYFIRWTVHSRSEKSHGIFSTQN